MNSTMIETVTIDNTTYNISQNPLDFFQDDPIKQRKCFVAIDMMKDCLDHIYYLLKPTFPNIFKPKLYLSDSHECNALAWKGQSIIIFAGLIMQQADFIEKKYTPEILERYNVLQEVPHNMILSGLRVYFWRYTLLHELYHIWNKHSLWKKLYEFDETGKLIQKIPIPANIDLTNFYTQLLENTFETEQNSLLSQALSEKKKQYNLTQQALELDADSSAISMIINMMMHDLPARGIAEDNKNNYIRNELCLIMAALAAAFSLFDGNDGAKFEKLADIEATSHPLSSLRMTYAEEIACACLDCYFPDVDEQMSLESEWQRFFCDVETDFNGQSDMGQAFYYPAYTETAQKHLSKIKHRMADIHDTMKPLVLANFSDKPTEDEMKFIPSLVWFTDEGKSMRNWTNPATGTEYAIRSDKIVTSTSKSTQKTYVRKHPKVGANDPCPCGSGKKFKKCCRGNGKYD